MKDPIVDACKIQQKNSNSSLSRLTKHLWLLAEFPLSRLNVRYGIGSVPRLSVITTWTNGLKYEIGREKQHASRRDDARLRGNNVPVIVCL